MKPKVYGFVSQDDLIDLDFTCLLIIDPNIGYFKKSLFEDANKYEKIILIHGCEPKAFMGDTSNEIIKNKNYFYKIFSFDEKVLTECPNAELFVFGSCWVLSDKVGEWIKYENEFVEKNFMKKFKVSFIKSSKNFLEGHRLRHSVPPLLNNKKFESLHLKNIPIKFPLFEDSMFHIAIENSKENNYFTEKIIDCFMTKTIPIYWGCPNIGNFFNLNGILSFNNIKELENILNNLDENYYFNRQEFIEENYKLAKKYAFFFERVNNYLKNL